MNECLICFNKFTWSINYSEIFLFRKNTRHYLCHACKSKFSRIEKNSCQNCSKPLKKASSLCEDCCYWKNLYQGKILKNTSLYRYNEVFHDIMVQYKRYGDYEMRLVFQSLLDKIPKADLYIPLPSSPTHLKKRSFDTIRSIYKDKVKLCQLLEKNDSESAQGEKNKAERLKTKQTFTIKQDISIKNTPQKILLLDDIYTTGRTLYHARDAVNKLFPQSEIQSLTLAH